MSDTTSVDLDKGGSTRRSDGSGSKGMLGGLATPKVLALLVVGIVLLIMPLYVDEFWLRTGFAACGAIIGAIGLNLLVGTTGQLSLAHAFFLAVGAITYVYVSGSSGGTATQVTGLELPPLLGMVLGVAMAGLAGPAVLPGRRPAAGHLPRCRLARSGLHRPAPAEHADLDHRRVQRAHRPAVLAVRLRVQQPQPGAVRGRRPVQRDRAAVVPRARPRPRRVPVRPQPAQLAGRPCAADAARQRGGRGGDGRERAGLQGPGVPGVLDVRRPGRGAATPCRSARSLPSPSPWTCPSSTWR